MQRALKSPSEELKVITLIWARVPSCAERRARAKHVCFAFSAAGVFRRSGLKKAAILLFEGEPDRKTPNATIL